MGNLLRMDLYRMRRSKSCWVCLVLAFAVALAVTPLAKLLSVLARLLSEEADLFPASAKLSEIIGTPFPMLNAMLAMLSACAFFYADVENGYIKNIAGQMPQKGYTILSKFLAIIPHNLQFMLVGVAGKLLGSVLFQRIVFDGGVPRSLGIFALKFLLIQSLCAVLLLVTSSFGSKSLGTVLAVLFGMGLLSLIYLGIDAGLSQLLPNMKFSLIEYMPDQLLRDSAPKALDAILVSAVTTGVFLPLAIRVFDRKDVK